MGELRVAWGKHLQGIDMEATPLACFTAVRLGASSAGQHALGTPASSSEQQMAINMTGCVARTAAGQCLDLRGWVGGCFASG